MRSQLLSHLLRPKTAKFAIRVGSRGQLVLPLMFKEDGKMNIDWISSKIVTFVRVFISKIEFFWLYNNILTGITKQQQ